MVIIVKCSNSRSRDGHEERPAQPIDLRSSGHRIFHPETVVYRRCVRQRRRGESLPALADFAVGAGLTHAKGMDLPLAAYPNIQAWNVRVMALDGFKKTAAQA